MKRWVALVGLVLPVFSHANVYDNSLVTNVETINACDAYDAAAAQQLLDNFDQNCSDNACYVFKNQSLSTQDLGHYCVHTLTITREQWVPHYGPIQEDGSQSVTSRLSNTSTYEYYQENVNKTQSEQCPPQVNPTYTYMREDENGTKYCYQPFSLEQNSNCPTSRALPYTLGQPNQVCMVMDDESRCSYKLTQENGTQFYEPSIEPLTCYDQTPEYNEPNLTGTPDPDCSDLGGGVYACLENPNNVCDSQGNCQSGCGTVGVNGQEYFVCLSGDTDGDGIGDYVDPDIDGDGIRNEDDIDADGDGQDDVNYNNNGSQSGDVVVNVPAPIVNVDGGATADEIAGVLTEQADFDISALDTLLETSTNDAIQNAINYVGSSETDLTDNVANSSASTALDSLTSILNSGTCTNFTIPLADTQLDICQHAPKVQTFLYILFALSTAWYCFHRILQTARET